MSFEPGSRIFDYEVAGILGAGGMGKVYKVRNVISDRTDAMKVLLPDLANQPELADRFLREIKVLASLNHPNIAAFHTALTFENQLIMVMEFVSGATLSQRLEQGPIPLPDAIKYTGQVLSALSYAHKQGVIHRDIKPANMMVTPEGNIKLMDFGIAKAATDPHLTRTGTTVGSLHYISPEQLTGTALDARSDLYSLGVALYEMATGKRPFEGKSEYALMAAHLQEAPRPPVEMNTNLPAGLNSVILMALEKDPANRFQSADAFRNALAEAAKGVPGVELKPGPVSVRQEAPAQSPVAQPVAPSVPAAVSQRGHRGTYMLLGAVIAIVIIVASAVELPRWFRARALTQATAPPAATAAPPSSRAPKPVPVSPPAPSPASSELTGGGSSAQPTASHAVLAPPPAPGAGVPAESSRREVTLSRKRSQSPVTQGAEKPPAGAPAAAASGVAASAGTAPATEAPPPPSSTAGFQALHDRMDQLAGRANAVKTTLNNLEQQMANAGQSLRPDVLASESRMERYLDEADAAFSARDAGSVQHEMDLAEKEISFLEHFLGR